MKQIINGRMYNTETAKMLGSDSNGLSPRDFGYTYEELYKKKTGEYFLYGEGGPNSCYSRSVGQNCWSGDSRIVPITEEKARAWGEKHLWVDDYIEAFGEPEE